MSRCNSGAGFVPVGNGNSIATSFHGLLDGQGFGIDGLTINTPSTFAAPFGLLYGTIRNVALTNESLSGNGAAGLVGNNVGTIDGVSVTGLVSGGLVGAGGLVGDNNGAIASSSVNATVQSSRGASGGLASSNFGNITQSSSSGSVSAQFDGAVGGLVGVNYGGTISESFSTASVASTGTFSGPAMVGGLIGWNQNSPTIHDVYATGSVSGPGFTDTGGLIGRDNAASGSIARGYAAGSVSGGFFAGGLVGRNTAFNYTNVYWDTSATGQGFSTGSGTLVGTGVPTNLLKVNLPTGFNGSVWGQSNAVNGGYPFLLWQTGTGSPSPPIVLTGSLPAAITLYYVADPKPSIYGQPIPTLTGTVTGLLPGDSLATATTGTLQFSTTASSASIVGTYPIVGFGLTALGNYVLAQAAANATAYTINPATLTITAKDQNKTYGQVFSFNGTEFSTNGLTNSDSVVNVNLSSLLGAPASATVAGSPYPITVSNAAGSGLGNYTIHYNSGLLSVVAVASPLPNTNDLSQFIQDATAIDQTNALAINLQSADSTSRSKSKESLDELRSAASAIIAGRLGEPYYLITIPNPPVISPGEAQYVLPYATLARDSNLDSSATGGLYGFAQVLGNDGKPEDWFTIMAMNGVSDSDIKQYKEAGFFARIYRNNLGEVVIAFRESVDHDSDHSTERWKNDWDKTNFPEVAGQTTAQYLAAAALTLAVKTVLKPNVLTVTGFSKGGGQASYSGKYANRIVTFDAARNHDADNGLNNARNEHQINVIVPGDKVGDPRSLVTYGVGQLPGLYASAQSSNSNTHSIDGIIGWLQGIARP